MSERRIGIWCAAIYLAVAIVVIVGLLVMVTRDKTVTATRHAPVVAPSTIMPPLTPTLPPGVISPSALPTAPSVTLMPTGRVVKYVVRPGDNLSTIAAAFKQHGWNPIYSWNQMAIGQNPSLIHPGQVLIVSITG